MVANRGTKLQGMYLTKCNFWPASESLVQCIPLSAAAMETLLNLVTLDILVQDEARIGASRLKLTNNWKTLRGHDMIEQVISKWAVTA